MNSNNREIAKINEKSNSFFELNQHTFVELLTFVDFADDKLNIGLVEINFAQDRDVLIEALIKHPDCRDIQFEVLDFPDPNLRFLRDELVSALTKIKIATDKKLILLITGLEKSIGILGEYPSVLANLNFVRDDLLTSVPHPLILFLPDYALTRLAKYAPDFWAWNRKVFCFKTTNRANLIVNDNTLVYVNESVNNLDLPVKQERIELLLHLLNEYNSLGKEETNNNLSTIINLYYELGNAYRSLGGYQKAIDYYLQSLEIAQEIGDRQGIGNSLGNLGNAYYSLGDYQKAMDFYQHSLEIKREIGDRQGIGASLNNLGNAYYSLGEYQKAIDYYQQSLEITQEIGNSQGIGNSLGNLGRVHGSLGDYQKAIDYYQQSLEIAQAIGDRQGISSSLMGLGNAYYSLSEYQKAIDYYQKSLRIAQEIGDRQGSSSSLGNLGNAYGSLGEYQKAIDHYQQSLEIKREIGDRYGEAMAWINLGLVQKNLQQPAEAKTAFENARSLYQAMGLDKKVEDCNKAIQDLEQKTDRI
jgi:tetratricopeptide (TPR) repeat protein